MRGWKCADLRGTVWAARIASALRPTGHPPRMKLQATATTAVFPAALVAASISLAFLLLPGAAVPAHSSAVAPALRLVAGEVVAAVQAPVHAVTRARRTEHPAVPSAKQSAIPATSQPQSASVPQRTVPAHHRRAGNHRVLRQHAVTPRPVTPKLAWPAPPSSITHHGNGKAKAWGHLKKPVPKGAPILTGTAPSALLHGGHGTARGHAAGAAHGPPAVPPGQAKKASGAIKHAAPRGHGGAK